MSFVIILVKDIKANDGFSLVKPWLLVEQR